MGEYRPNTIVWVKWKRIFWPAKVVPDDSLPDDLQSTIKARPVACIKFLNEDFYDIIYEKKKLQRYICAEKYNYIKQGIEIKDSKDLEMFKEAVKIAEEEISGNPNIIDSEEMKTKEPKPSAKYKEIFPSASDKKKKRKLENEEESAPKKSKSEDFDRSKYYEVIYLPQTELVDTEPLSNFTSTCPECGYRTAYVQNAVMHYRTHYDKSFDFRRYINYRQTYSFAGKKRKSKKSAAKKVSAAKKDVGTENKESVTPTKEKPIKSKKKPKLVGKELKKQLLEDWEEEEDEQSEDVEEIIEEKKADQSMESAEAAFDALLADTQVPVIPKAPLPLPARDDYEFIESDEDRISTAGDYFSQWCQGAQSDDDEDEAAEARLESGPVTPVMEESNSSNADNEKVAVSSSDVEDDESCEVDMHKNDQPEYEDISEVEQNPEMSDSDKESKGESSTNIEDSPTDNVKEKDNLIETEEPMDLEDSSNKEIDEVKTMESNFKSVGLEEGNSNDNKSSDEVKEAETNSEGIEESNQNSNPNNQESEAIKEMEGDLEESNQEISFSNKVSEIERRSETHVDPEESSQDLNSSSKNNNNAQDTEDTCETFVEPEELNENSNCSIKEVPVAKAAESKGETSMEPEPTTERITVSDVEKKSSSKKLLERFLKEQEQMNAQQNKVQSEVDEENREVPEVLEVTEVQDMNEDAVCISSSRSPDSFEDRDTVIVVKSTPLGAPVENGVVEVQDDSEEEDNDDVVIVSNDNLIETDGVVTVMDEESNASSEEVTVIYKENEVMEVEEGSPDKYCDEALDLRNRSSRGSKDSEERKRSNHNHSTEEIEALDCSYKGKGKEASGSKKSVPSPDCEYVSDSEEEPDEATIQSFKMASLREDVEKEEVVTINEEDNNYILIEIDESGSISISQDDNEKSSQPRL